MVIPSKFHRQPKCFKKFIFAKAVWTKSYTVPNGKENLATIFPVGIKWPRKLFNCKSRSYFIEKYMSWRFEPRATMNNELGNYPRPPQKKQKLAFIQKHLSPKKGKLIIMFLAQCHNFNRSVFQCAFLFSLFDHSNCDNHVHPLLLWYVQCLGEDNLIWFIFSRTRLSMLEESYIHLNLKLIMR